MGNGFPNPTYKKPPRDGSIYIVSRSKRFVTSICLQGILLIKRFKKGSKRPAIPTETKLITIPSGQKMASKFENGKIELMMGIHHGKREKPITVYTKNLPQGKTKEIELCYNHRLYLSIAFEDGKQNQPYEKKQSAGVDPGEIHTLAAFAESGKSVIITGRKVRSIHRLRNKKCAEIQRLQSKCKKGSRQWKKYQKAKRYILSKSEKQLQDALHKTTKQFVDWCVKQSVSDLYMGNPEGVQRKTRKKKKAT